VDRYHNLIEHSADGIAIVQDGVIKLVNSAGVRMSGYNKEELLGMPFTQLVTPDCQNLVLERYRARLAGKEVPSLYEIRFVTKDNQVRDVEVNAALAEYEGRSADEIIVRDITERKQAEERERQLQQELNIARRMASIGEMAAGVAHEINNPLTGIIGFSQLLISRDIPADAKQELIVINNEARRLAKIVLNLLAFANHGKPGREYVDINHIISRVLELHAYEMTVHNIEVAAWFAHDLPRTMADAGQLQQVFLNIITNAEKEMIKAHNRGKLSVKTERIGDSIRCSFTDDGPGISKENLDRIFEPFFTTRGKGNGTGLGLSICHGIVAQHKGRIYAESEPGEGATFVVELPIVAHTKNAEETIVIEEEPWQQRGAKILVVDNELSILDFLKRLLTEEGYQVETVARAHKALKRLESEKYDLILLDVKLPGMNGIELYRRIQAMDPALAQRILFITGDVLAKTTRDFFAQTKMPHIAKPFTIEQLKREINHMLSSTMACHT